MKIEKMHGLSDTRLYRIHHNMKSRCYNPNVDCWDSYGGRGIKICAEWLEYDHENKINSGFLNFYKWAMENGYTDEFSIDRIDVNGNYCPENCRWIDMKFQNNNRNDNRYLEYKGYNFTLAIWSEITKLDVSTITSRLSKKWSIEDTLRTPPGAKRGEGYLCWEVIPDYIKYHNSDLNREQTNSKRAPLSEETKRKLSESRKEKPNLHDRKLNDMQIYLIKLLHNEGYTDRELGRIFDISHSIINRIVNNRRYVKTKYDINSLLNE